jgi:hypothetical protein
MPVLIIVEFDIDIDIDIDVDTDTDIKSLTLFSNRINHFVSNVPLIARSPAPVRAANLCDALMSPAADSLRYAATPALRTIQSIRY